MLPQIGIRALRCDRGEEPEFGNAQILRLIDDNMGERFFLAIFNRRGDSIEK